MVKTPIILGGANMKQTSEDIFDNWYKEFEMTVVNAIPFKTKETTTIVDQMRQSIIEVAKVKSGLEHFEMRFCWNIADKYYKEIVKV